MEGRLFVDIIPTYRDNGELEKYKKWKKILYFRKKYAKIPRLVKTVKYDIVGYKRPSKELPAGVVIDNITFGL